MNVNNARIIDVFNSAKPVSQSFKLWLRAACVAVSTDGKISQVQVDMNALDPATIPSVVWDEFQEEVKDMKTAVQPLGEAMDLKTAIVVKLILWLLRFMAMLAADTSTVILTTY